MKEKIYKYSVITFLMINLIILYLFYDYLIEKPMILYGIGLLVNFLRLMFLSLGLGIILLLLRLFFHLSKNKNYLKTNFFYVFSGIFSFYILINLLICIYMELLPFNTENVLIALVLMIISVFMLYDIYKNNFLKANYVSD